MSPLSICFDCFRYCLDVVLLLPLSRGRPEGVVCELVLTPAGIRWLKQQSLLHLGHAENGVPWARFSGMLYLGDVELPQSGGVMYTFRIM